MTWFRCGGGGSGIPAALKNRMNAVLNKKFGATVDYPPNGWPDDVNLLGELEEKTAAASSICTFADGADEVPLKNWLVTLPASLDGYSEVNGVRSGKNLIDLSSLVDGYVNSNGTFSTNHKQGEMRSGFIPVKPNTVYYFSIVETTGPAADWVGIGEYTSDNTTDFVRRDSYWRFTTSATTKYVVVSSRNLEQATKIQLEIANDPTTWEPYTTPTTYTASLGRTIYGGTADIVNGTGTDENGNAFTFTPITPTPETALGTNNFWADEGDSTVVYRGQGTVTPVLPTLISKTITENGTYSAEDDGADGYDEVTVNVSGGGTIIVDDLIEYPYPNNDNKCIYSSKLNTQYAYYAFNPDCGNPYYWSSVGATNQYIGWKFDTAQIVNYYEIWTRNVGNQYDYLQAPKEWKLQGSNDDGITWIDLDAQDFTFTASGQKWASAVNNTTAYKWYRIYVITAQDTSNDTVIGYIDFKHAYISA